MFSQELVRASLTSLSLTDAEDWYLRAKADLVAACSEEGGTEKAMQELQTARNALSRILEEIWPGQG